MEFYDILNVIGNTPILRLAKVSSIPIFAKAEYLNPGGSVKDRVAKYMITQAEKRGDLQPGSVIIEATSGNTGIAVAFVGIHRGYRVIIVMPEDMSEERKKIIRALGAELVLTPSQESLTGSVNKVKELAAGIPNAYVVGQFENPDNPEVHYLTTGAELWKQLEGNVDAFVAGVGSGGTLGGAGKFLKEQNSLVKIVAVEPENSAALLGQEPGLHQIQGIGDGFVPPVLDVSLIDEVVTVSDENAIEMARKLAGCEGTLVGTSSGANVWAAIKVARELGPDKRVVTILPDRIERYFSTSLI
ncbi:MAG: cysteine synthase A [Deltaproteobacteria bacterium]|nr:cysteine synthase A [Candidatus Anaeroferrophillus wilburensis]MBN2888941.1 cysteine synthase A [Deltaproteobacteria bacterium]